MGIKKRLNNDYTVSFLNKIFSIACGFLTSIFINRYLGPELKGKYSYILNWINIIAIVGNLGFYQSYPYQKRQRVEKQFRRYVDVFSLQFILYFILTIVIACVAGKKYILPCLLIPVQIFSQQMSMIMLVDFLRVRQIIQIISYVLDLLFSFALFILMPQRLAWAFAVLMIKHLAIIVGSLWYIKYVPNPFNSKFKDIKEMFYIGFFSMLSALLITMNYKVDVLMMERYLVYKEIGLYSVGATFAEYIWLIPDAFKEVLFSHTAKSDSIEEIIMAIKINLSIAFVCVIAFLSLGKYMLIFMYGTEYEAAFSVTAIILFGVPSMILFKLIGPLVIAKGKQKFYFFSLFISVIANVGLNVLLMPLMAKEGAAIASIVSYTLCGGIFFIYFIRKNRISLKAFLIHESDVKKLIKYFGGGNK